MAANMKRWQSTDILVYYANLNDCHDMQINWSTIGRGGGIFHMLMNGQIKVHPTQFKPAEP